MDAILFGTPNILSRLFFWDLGEHVDTILFGTPDISSRLFFWDFGEHVDTILFGTPDISSRWTYPDPHDLHGPKVRVGRLVLGPGNFETLLGVAHDVQVKHQEARIVACRLNGFLRIMRC